MSAIKHKFFSRLIDDSRGEAIISFAILLPMLLMVSLGTLEFALIAFDYHRAGEATRRAARIAVVKDPIIAPVDFAVGQSSTCTGAGAAVSCSGGAVGTAATFTQIVTSMQAILPSVTAENVQVVYRDSGLGDPTLPGGIIPLVTVRIINLQQQFHMISGIMGMPNSFTFPSFETSQMGSGLGPAL
ncbi:MAG: pilus assembly protein [Rhodospirillales bacterium]|nr:pilus assembly protein [Rhodospirillales bacterium]